MVDVSCFKRSKLLRSEEQIGRYRPGGFHPVKIGDTFHCGRYEVCHKLGWGGFSTVWLARDQQYVTLVLIRATHLVVELLDAFLHQGPNGDHQCLVFELLGPAVDSVVFDHHHGGDRLDADTILRITRRLLQAVSAMHRAGYAHGDISGANVAFTTSRLATLSLDDLLKVIGAPKTEKLVRRDGEPLAPGLPEQLVQEARWDDWSDEDEEDIRLIDLGESFPHATPPAKLAEPWGLQSPEGIFTGKFDHRVDLWRAGCTIYFLVMALIPFNHLGDMNALVGQMIHFVEDLPAEWRPQWECMKQAATRSWDHIPAQMPAQSKLEETFTKKVTEPGLAPLLPVISGLMRFRPRDRISADEALALLDGHGT
ncbi:kinase-like domain-containing protein [Chaetomium fimeti]|uniref:non-specific serine/threonine protein kinase n=1 Tax=Chaetomium fimeti TaxID=1854472 RepID=A0AAE0HIX5_9PEZI|nr:kinase-like domain-containing protein [Chaetomium fimeti]